MKTFALGLCCAVAALGQDGFDPKLHGLSALLDGSAFVQIQAGEFEMGSKAGNPDEQPVHRIRISKGFQLSKFEVTQAQWEALMRPAHPSIERARVAAGAEPVSAKPSHFKGQNLPVESVSWTAVQQFLEVLNNRDSTHIYRLPTEAEWEYACRAGKTESAAIDEVAWHEANAGGETHSVGAKKPNAFGLYDMLGNVFEWVQDSYANDYYDRSPAEDPPGPPPGSYRVYRGGAWTRSPAHNRCGFRGFDFPTEGYYNVGFRLVRTAK